MCVHGICVCVCVLYVCMNVYCSICAYMRVHAVFVCVCTYYMCAFYVRVYVRAYSRVVK